MKFKKESLKEQVWGDGPEEWKVLVQEHTGESRWSQHWRIVFEVEGRFYETTYSIGSTESQDERPYEYDDDEIECKQVFPKSKIVTYYE